MRGIILQSALTCRRQAVAHECWSRALQLGSSQYHLLQRGYAMQLAPCWIGAAEQSPIETPVSCRMPKGPVHARSKLCSRMPQATTAMPVAISTAAKTALVSRLSCS